MIKSLSLLLLTTLMLSTVFADGDPAIPEITYQMLKPEVQHRKVSQEVTRLLTQAHYQKRNMDDELSSETYDRFLEKLDYYRLYLLESDIQSFEKHRYFFDNYINSGQVERVFDMFNIYQQRYAERLEYVFKRLETEFDFTLDEAVEIDRSRSPWAKTSAELDEVWRKRLKHAALSLKLAKKDWPGIQKTLRQRYIRSAKNLEQYQSEDAFQLLMNAFSESFDPHTNYFSPKNFDDFKIRMSQSLEGIGARLVTENEFTKVAEIITGGPADKSKNLHANDLIVGVGQDMDGELVDVVGWRIDDVVQLIRGKKTTIVRLIVYRADDPAHSKPDTLSLVRDRVKLEDQSATSEMIEVPHLGKTLKIGVVAIPTFYSDFDAMRRREADYKSTTRDVRRFLEEFKEKGVDGVVIDLRGNGGGFLNEAVDLTGLFIKDGPVVQVKSTRGTVDVERDRDPSITYDGPLAVMVDRLSASASEIFAAAIQDYNRGIIIGNQSFGKGTVQRPVDLNSMMPDEAGRLGQVKLTIAKFYRIDGKSTQHVGVMPDISLPSHLDPKEFGESTRENALVYDRIDPVPHQDAGDVNNYIARLDKQHAQRVAGDAKFTDLVAELKKMQASHERKEVSLNEAVRRKERAEDKQVDDDEAEEEAAVEAKPGKEDLLLTETAHVLGDYILLESLGYQGR